MCTVDRESRHHSPRGFTLIEMLVVIAIIGVLASLLLPALLKVKERGKMIFCQNNLRNLAIALRKYCMLNGGYFPNIGEGPYYGRREYPVEYMCRTMELIREPFSAGGQAPRVVLCPSCEITAAYGEDHVCRHYAVNWHLDSSIHTVDWMDYMTMVYRGVFPSDEHIWPHLPSSRPNASWASYQPYRLDHVNQPDRVMAFMDSNDEDYGHSAANKSYYSWHMYASSNYYDMVPSRHLNGGNLAFLDGHVEHQSEAFFIDAKNQPKWLCGADTGNSHAWRASMWH